MKKNNKLIVISLVAVIAIYGTYKVAFADSSEQGLVKVYSTTEEQETNSSFSEDKNISKVKTIAKRVLKKITKPKSDELIVDDDEDDAEEDCYRQGDPSRKCVWHV